MRKGRTRKEKRVQRTQNKQHEREEEFGVLGTEELISMTEMIQENRGRIILKSSSQILNSRMSSLLQSK